MQQSQEILLALSSVLSLPLRGLERWGGGLFLSHWGPEGAWAASIRVQSCSAFPQALPSPPSTLAAGIPQGSVQKGVCGNLCTAAVCCRLWKRWRGVSWLQDQKRTALRGCSMAEVPLPPQSPLEANPQTGQVTLDCYNDPPRPHSKACSDSPSLF